MTSTGRYSLAILELGFDLGWLASDDGEGIHMIEYKPPYLHTKYCRHCGHTRRDHPGPGFGSTCNVNYCGRCGLGESDHVKRMCCMGVDCTVAPGQFVLVHPMTLAKYDEGVQKYCSKHSPKK